MATGRPAAAGGRILRQGNQNLEVQILRYVTEESFDGYSWQTVARKAQFIAQVMRGRLDVREIDDIGDNALSYNEVKAPATGNPLLLEHAEATAELTRLERPERAQGRAQEALGRAMIDHQERLVLLDQRVTRLEEAIAARRDTRGDRFAMAHADVRAELFVAGLGDTTVKVSLTSMKESKSTGMIASLEHRLGILEQLLEDTHQAITDTRAEIARADGQRGKPFELRDALITARRRVAELNQQMQEQATPDQDDAVDSTPDNASLPTDHATDPVAHVDSAAALARQSAPVPTAEVVVDHDDAVRAMDPIMAGEDPEQELREAPHHPLTRGTDALDEQACRGVRHTPDAVPCPRRAASAATGRSRPRRRGRVMAERRPTPSARATRRGSPRRRARRRSRGRLDGTGRRSWIRLTGRPGPRLRRV
jgi:hypothetical protein